MKVPEGGASCLGVGRPGWGALPPPTTRPFGRAAGAHYPVAVGAWGAGVGFRQQPHSARSWDTRTGQPGTRSAGRAGREGGNGRDTTPGTGPSPRNRPRAPHTHRRGTAPAKAVVAHCATPQPLG